MVSRGLSAVRLARGEPDRLCTYTPDPMRTSTQPSTSSAINASRTDGRDTPSFSARSRSGGKRAPTGNSPASISKRSWSAIWRYKRRGSMVWIGMVGGVKPDG